MADQRDLSSPTASYFEQDLEDILTNRSIDTEEKLGSGLKLGLGKRDENGGWPKGKGYPSSANRSYSIEDGPRLSGVDSVGLRLSDREEERAEEEDEHRMRGLEPDVASGARRKVS